MVLMRCTGSSFMFAYCVSGCIYNQYIYICNIISRLVSVLSTSAAWAGSKFLNPFIRWNHSAERQETLSVHTGIDYLFVLTTLLFPRRAGNAASSDVDCSK